MSRAPRYAQLEELSPRECLQLLAVNHFGRLAFMAGGVPHILPVNYRYADPSLVIRTIPGTKMSTAPQSMVAFEIDEVDAEGEWGWSVVLHGPAYDITDSIDGLSGALRELPVATDAPGERDHWLKVVRSTVTGRWFGRHPLDEHRWLGVERAGAR